MSVSRLSESLTYQKDLNESRSEIIDATRKAETYQSKIEQLKEENEELRAVLQYIVDIECERLDEVQDLANKALTKDKE